MNEVSKCAEVFKTSSFDNPNFPIDDVNIEIWVRKATLWKLSLSSLGCHHCGYSDITLTASIENKVVMRKKEWGGGEKKRK